MKILQVLLLIAALTASALAALTPQEVQQAAGQIDRLMADHWKKAGVAPGAPIGDETFLRRIYLDLAGRIPTAREASAFLDSKKPDKRATLIAELLGRESYV